MGKLFVPDGLLVTLRHQHPAVCVATYRLPIADLNLDALTTVFRSSLSRSHVGVLQAESQESVLLHRFYVALGAWPSDVTRRHDKFNVGGELVDTDRRQLCAHTRTTRDCDASIDRCHRWIDAALALTESGVTDLEGIVAAAMVSA